MQTRYPGDAIRLPLVHPLAEPGRESAGTCRGMMPGAFSLIANFPKYLVWQQEQDMGEAYAFHKLQLPVDDQELFHNTNRPFFP